MGRKRKITTEEITDEPQAPDLGAFTAAGLQNAPADMPTPEESELQDFYRTTGPSVTRIKVYKVTARGTQAYCGSSDPAAVTEDYLLQTWGPGRYLLRAMIGNEYHGHKSIEVYGPPEEPLNAISRAGRDNQAAPFDGGGHSQIDLLREQINRQHEMLLKLMESRGQNAAAAPVPTIGEIISAVKEMNAFGPKAVDPAEQINVVLSSLTKGIEIAQAANSGDEKMSWLRVIEHVMEKLPAIAAPFVARVAGNGSTKPAAVRSDGDGQAEFLRSGLAYLKKKSLTTEPGLWVDFIAGNLDEAQNRDLALRIIAQPFEKLFEFDRELQNEPFNSWFRDLYFGLKDALSTSGNPTNPDEIGERGDNPDAS